MVIVDDGNLAFEHTCITAHIHVSAGPPSNEQVTSAGTLSISTQLTSRDVGLSLVAVQFKTSRIEIPKFVSCIEVVIN